MIKYENGELFYFDKNGREITEGCKIKYSNGKIMEVYLTENDELGTDATNPIWIEKGWAAPCEYGIYPLTREETEEVEIVKTYLILCFDLYTGDQGICFEAEGDNEHEALKNAKIPDRYEVNEVLENF